MNKNANRGPDGRLRKRINSIYSRIYSISLVYSISFFRSASLSNLQVENFFIEVGEIDTAAQIVIARALNHLAQIGIAVEHLRPVDRCPDVDGRLNDEEEGHQLDVGPQANHVVDATEHTSAVRRRHRYLAVGAHDRRRAARRHYLYNGDGIHI